MTWVKTGEHFFNLDSIAIVQVDLHALALEIHAPGLGYSYRVCDEEAIALIEAIEQQDCMDRANPLEHWGTDDDDDDDEEQGETEVNSNSGIPL